MFSGWWLTALAVVYLGSLFAIAHFGDRRGTYSRHVRLRPYIYSLALGVYCTSWTFFGAVGSAVREGWGYTAIYVGPVLVFMLAPSVLRRLIEVGRTHNVTSIADFVAARFGKSRAIAILVTLIAVIAAIPYLALQYKAVAASIDTLTSSAPGAAPWYRDTALAVALLMSLFAILFGARRVDAAKHREGLMLAIAFESLLKLLAFSAIALYAWSHLGPGGLRLPPRLSEGIGQLDGNVLINALLAAAAIVCLPRQFQVSVVECIDVADLRHARWMLPAYLACFTLLVLPIVALGHARGLTAHGSADMLVLTLPMSYGASWLAILVFLGGLSAATAMVVVASIALATMIANDIAAPLFWYQRLAAGDGIGRRLLWVRRGVILALALLAYSYNRLTADSTSLAAIGLLAFSAVAQFAPAILAGLYWSGASRAGVFWGMLCGFVTWSFLVFAPNLAAGLLLPVVSPTVLGHLFGPGSVAPGALLALSVNVFVLAIVSSRRPATLQERLSARAFVGPRARDPASLSTIRARVGDLETVAARVIGVEAARQALEYYARQAGIALPKPTDAAGRGVLQHFERVMTASIGAPSARVVLTHALKRKGLAADEVAELLDETSQELRFSRRLLQATMENVTQGISVVDAEMRLVAWNRRYLEMFDYPPDMVYVGRPVADLIRWNAERGEFGVGDSEYHIDKRLAHLRAGTAYEFQRTRRNAQVYSIHGQPMAGGGYVTTYTDITEYKRTEQALLEAKQGLEARVQQRTQELVAALEAQRAAKQQAEEANIGKTRFVAAASHDLLQPLNAARLFASALETRARAQRDLGDVAEMAARIDESMRAAEELLSDLLDIARLDSGVLKPVCTTIPIADLIEDLRRQYAPLAQARNLKLDVAYSHVSVYSDRVLLRRIIQNYLSNALRYTERGGVAVGCRRRGAELEIVVYDTGPGVDETHREQIYGEFTRIERISPWGEKGLGLGLSICDRLARLLGHTLTLSTRPGHGSAFGVRVARDVGAPIALRPAPVPVTEPAGLHGLRVLCVDNDASILDGMNALLTQWGVQTVTARDAAEARELYARGNYQALLIDYHLGDGPDGLELLRQLRQSRAHPPGAVLITADRSGELAQAARAAGVPILHKPLRPAALRALLSALRTPKVTAA